MKPRASTGTSTPLSLLLLTTLVVACLLLVCAGCHKNDAPQPAPSAAGPQPAAGQESPENQKILDDFNRKHPGMGPPTARK